METMAGMFNHVHHMASKGIIDIDDFYNVSFDRSVISLQGHYRNDVVASMSEFFTFSTNAMGFVTAIQDIDGQTVRVTLT